MWSEIGPTLKRSDITTVINVNKCLERKDTISLIYIVSLLNGSSYQWHFTHALDVVDDLILFSSE